MPSHGLLYLLEILHADFLEMALFMTLQDLFLHVTDDRKLYMLLAFLDSKVANFYLKIMNPTINFPPGYIQAIPFSKECQTDQIENLSKSCTDMSKNDWDAFETILGL